MVSSTCRGPRGCAVTLVLTNRSAEAMPAGIGLHPYFRRAPESEVRFDAGHVLLSGADLRKANLSNANLHGAKLVCADLRECNLMYANLTDVDLRGALIEGLRGLPGSANEKKS